MAPSDTSLPTTGTLHALALVDTCWTIPILTAMSSFLVSMPQINSGVFYVFFIDEMGATREEASWPKSIILATGHLTGILVGVIQHSVPILTVQLIGASLCPLSIIASAFVPNMTWMSVTFGFLYGASRGLFQIAMDVYLLSYFDHYRSVAMGITLAIGALAGVAGPSLLVHLSSAYGLKGTLLVTGGLMLNLIPLTLMMRNPRPFTWSTCRNTRSVNEMEAQENRFTHGRTVVPVGSNLGFNNSRSSDCKEMVADTKLGHERDVTARKIASVGTPQLQPPLPCSESLCQDEGAKDNAALLETFSMLRKTCFYVLVVVALAADFTFPVINSTLADYGIDKGLASKEAAQLITLLCLGGVCGHFIVSLFADKLQCPRCVLAVLACTLLAVCFFVVPHVGSFASLCGVTFVAGLQFGYLLTIKPVLVADYLGVKCLALSTGIMGTLSLPVVFTEPSIVGIFRDNCGSYDNLYRTCGAINLFAALLLSTQACFGAENARNIKISCS